MTIVRLYRTWEDEAIGAFFAEYRMETMELAQELGRQAVQDKRALVAAYFKGRD